MDNKDQNEQSQPLNSTSTEEVQQPLPPSSSDKQFTPGLEVPVISSRNKLDSETTHSIKKAKIYAYIIIGVTIIFLGIAVFQISQDSL
jgi:hypothetical protein